MGLLGNLARIAAAPVAVIDKVLIEPLADVADDVAEGFGATKPRP